MEYYSFDGSRLNAARKKQNLTLEELANKANTSKSQIWELENNATANPGAILVRRLAIILHVRMEYFFGDEEEFYVDEDGNIWFSPTPWAYAKLCKAFNNLKELMPK